MVQSDEELMSAYIAGNREAFRELFRRYGMVVLRIVGRGLPSTDAHDLVQQTFLLLHVNRHDFRHGARLRPWLCTIAINVRRKYLRATRRYAPVELGELTAPASGNDAVQQIRTALSALSAEQQQVITLHWIEGLSFSEVAEAVGASLSAVKVRAHRGYQAMRRSLSETPGNDSEHATRP